MFWQLMGDSAWVLYSYWCWKTAGTRANLHCGRRKQPDVAGWNLPLCSLAVLEGPLPSFRGSSPWPFFWRQGPYPSRGSAFWNCNAVVCSTAGQLDLISKQTCLLGLAHFKVLPWIWMETRGSEWFDTHSLDLTYCMVIAWCVCQKKSKRCVPVQAQIDW